MSDRCYRFHTCDLFTERRLGGNPLAVLTDGARAIVLEEKVGPVPCASSARGRTSPAAR
jgi:hypothetical protein